MALLKKKEREESPEKTPKREKKPKKEKKVMEPQYGVSANNMRTYNYKVYHMSKREKVLYFLLAFAVGAAVGYLFYGGIGKDEYGNPTTLTWILDIGIPCAVGLVAGRAFLPIRTQQIIDKKRNALKHQFRDLLEALTTALGAGSNVSNAFKEAYNDLKVQYESDAPIIQEVRIILAGLRDNVKIEDLLVDFGERSGIDDIRSFADVFRVCFRKGINVRDTIRNTHDILSDKMEISEDIETILTANKTEQNIMIVMPVLLIGMIKMISPDFAANFVTPAGIFATTLGIGLFVASYYIGRAVLNIKV